MTALTLYFAPDSCARVPLIALEEIGAPYRIEVVAFMSGQHRSAEYLALNPKGKVPTLVVDGEPLSEKSPSSPGSQSASRRRISSLHLRTVFREHG